MQGSVAPNGHPYAELLRAPRGGLCDDGVDAVVDLPGGHAQRRGERGRIAVRAARSSG
jgi:hypothetical protein